MFSVVDCKLKMKLAAAIILIVFSLAKAAEYVPGTPGAVWSEEEVRIVRLKILELLSLEPQKTEEMFPTKGSTEFSAQEVSDMPVSELALFRLSFHDCLAYEDGSPGCDGCLNWKNMGNLPPSPFPAKKKDGTYCEHQFERADRTDNNGLLRITHYLEKIYTDKDWPNYEHAKAPVLDVSLKDSGKSRADLWQFAASVAMESTIERSNHACRYDMWERQQVPLLEGVNKGHDLAYGIWKCKIKLTKPVKFRFGRKDCIPETTEENPTLPAKYPFATWKPELQENPHENIGPLLKHLKANLEMKARDFIALSSIHGMVRPFQGGSIGTKYRWLGSGPYLSNMYYKYLINMPTYDWKNGFGMNPKTDRLDENVPELPYTNFMPVAIGDAEGKPVAKWGFRVGCSNCWNTTQTTMGGPCVWRPTANNQDDCPNVDQISYTCYGGYDSSTGEKIINSNSGKATRCCGDVTFDKNGIQKGASCSTTTSDGRWSNMFALNYEVALTHKFDIDEVAFRPTGCKGLELPDITTDWGYPVSNSQYLSPVAECDKQDLVADGTPIYDIVEEFAEDHSVWAEAFLEAWQAMQELRQDQNDMKDGPANSWLGYYPLQEMGAVTGTTGEEFTSFIQANSPVVFTSEANDPYTCHNNKPSCYWRVSDIYKRAKVPIEAMGPFCSDFEECNNPEF